MAVPRPPTGDTWVIQIHGRGTNAGECLRAVPVFHARASPPSSCRIATTVKRRAADGTTASAPPSGGTSTRPSTSPATGREAHRADGLVDGRGDRAADRPQRRAHRELIGGLVLESPVIDWRVVDYQAAPRAAARRQRPGDRCALEPEWAGRVTDGRAIPFDRLDVVARANELRQPILILHSDDDGFVPFRRLARSRERAPDLVEMQVFESRAIRSSGTTTRIGGATASAPGSSGMRSLPHPQPQIAESRVVDEHPRHVRTGMF